MSTVASPKRKIVWLLVVFMMQRIARAAFVTTRRRIFTTTAFQPHAPTITIQPNLRLYATKRQTKNVYTSKLTVRGSPNENRPFRLVIVESPSKCETISKILQKYVKDQDLPHDYVVASSMGHVRNLPKSKSNKNETIVGVDVEHGYKPTYEILPGKHGLVQELQNLAARAEHVVLATDKDREGEAVAWHLLQLLPDSTDYSRVVFSEITPTAIAHAMQEPHDLDLNLVEAQETRRVLDRLAGYTLSPILWKKIAPGLSAGRVQSVGMALVVQRERERLAFRPAEYYDLNGWYTLQQQELSATMVALNGLPLATGSDFVNSGKLKARKKHHLATNSSAQELVQVLKGEDVTWTVKSVKSTRRRESPPMPFITSTLQQEANKRLGMSVSQTMRNAQSLYEAGYISYMRTDSTRISNDAHAAIEKVVTDAHGSNLLAPKRQDNDKKKSKKKQGNNGKSVAPQDAHEAIRPAVQQDGSFLHPRQLDSTDANAIKLYELIYQRTLASGMTPLITNQTSVEIDGTNNGETTATFRTSGSIVLDAGYTLAMPKVSSSDSKILPPLKEGQELTCTHLQAMDHTTQPPPRYTEASFVKKLEELGVGRPSTYAHTVQILRDRAYVGTPIRAKGGKNYRSKEAMTGPAISAHRAAGGEEFTGGGRGPMVPSLSAFVVCSLLENNCPTYVDPTFTAGMEEKLDEIAQGVDTNENSRVAYLDEFYAGDDGLAAKVDRIDKEVSANEARRANLPSLFSDSNESKEEDIGLFIGPWGPYVQKISNETTSDIDEKPITAPLPPGMAADLSTITAKTLSALLSSREKNGILLGTHPEDGRDIRLKVGRFGAYLQWGRDDEEGTTSHSLPKHIGGMRNLGNGSEEEGDESLGAMIGLTLEDAVGYVGLPRTVCTLNDMPITAAIGPYGPYLKYNNSFASLYEKDGDVLTVDKDTALRIVTEGIINKPKGMARGVIAELGEKDGSMVRVKDGRFGVYINWKKVNAKLPAEYKDTPEEVPLEEAWDLIQAKAATTPSKAGGRKKKTKKGAAINDSVALPPAPKRPLSAYLHFCAEKRPEASKKFSSLGDVSKELSRLWAETDPATVGNSDLRSKYEDLAAQGKKEYEEKMKQWREECQQVMASATSETKKKKGATKKNRVKKKASVKKRNGAAKKTAANGSAPKKPRSAYIYFCSANRPEAAKKFSKLGDISKELARLWAEAASDGGEGRREFERLAAEDKVRYEKEMIQYKAGSFQ